MLGYESLRTVATLLLTNSSFRLFLTDLTTISKQVFADTANTLSSVAAEAAEQVEPSSSETTALKSAANGTGKATEDGKKPASNGAAPTTDKLEENAGQIAEVIADGFKKTADEAIVSTRDNVTDQKAKETMLKHLKTAVGRLTKRPDYNDSVSTISVLLQRYAKVYSRALDKTVAVVQDDVETNDELDRAVKNGWLLLANFGNKSEWEALEKKFNAVMAHSQKDPEFEKMMEEVASSLQKMLTDPEFFDEPSNAIEAIKEKYEEVGQSTSDSPMKKDVEALLKQAKRTFQSVLNDQDISKLLTTTYKLWAILNPLNIHSNRELFQDSYTIFLPMLITAIQYLPIPRLEISVPEIDLLLENVIIEPGKTVNNSSFLPFRLKVETYNDLTIHKRKFRTVSSVASLVTVKVQGLSVRAEEVRVFCFVCVASRKVHPKFLASIFARSVKSILELAISPEWVKLFVPVPTMNSDK
jgi:hypothetical protein